LFLEKNNKIRTELFQRVDLLTDQQFNEKPNLTSWSPKEIIEHLVRLEKMITKGIKFQLANPSSPHAMKKPIQLITIRVIKVKAPSYIVPSGEYQTIEEMKALLDDARAELLSLYASTDLNTFKTKSMKHPLFGQVPLIQWFAFVGLHEKRHTKQLEKTIKIVQSHKK